MEFKPKNREWVKNAAIAFLAVLLVLTFFSNTIMNRTLPEVATQYVESGPITAKVRGTGTVVANGSHQVKADQTREIRAVMVKAGQEVSAGDVLFVLGQGASEELEQAQEALRTLQLSYQKAAISLPTFDPDRYLIDENRIKRAEADKKEAKRARDNAKAQLDPKDEQLITDAENNLNAAKNSLDNVKLLAAKSETEAQNKVNEAYNEYQKALGDKVPPAPPTPSDNPEGTTPPENTGGNSEAGGTENGEGGAKGDKSGVEPPPDIDITENSDKDNINQTEQQTKNNPVSASADLMPQILSNTNPEESKKGFTQEEIDARKKVFEDAQRELSQLQIDNAASIKFAQNNYDRCKTIYDGLKNQGGLKYEEYRKAQKEFEEADDNLRSLQIALKEKKDSDNKTSQLASIDLSDIGYQIEQQKKKIKELSGGEDNEITAKVSGTVQTVDCTSGDTKVKDDLLCTIEVPDMGYTMSFSVTNDQARRLRPGDTATVSNFYWGNEIKATLSSIKVDPKNPQTNKLLSFDLEGDVNAGSELTLSVGQKSANYDVIIPNSSIRNDTNGSFVLKIEAKNSPLGNRYIARRVSVEVLAADDVNSAVTGDLGYGDYVITTSNAPVKTGDQVRMADS